MFNLSGSEIVFLLIIGLVVLGPEKLPTALRKAGRLYGEFRRITSGAESEFRSAFAEPLRELQDRASGYKSMFTDAATEVTNVEPIADILPLDIQTSDGDDIVDGM